MKDDERYSVAIASSQELATRAVLSFREAEKRIERSKLALEHSRRLLEKQMSAAALPPSSSTLLSRDEASASQG
jgi:hypothetical protein